MAKSIKNDPTKAGALAGRKHMFGNLSRFAVAPVHTRFDAVQWFVWDANRIDPVTGKPDVIRQFDDASDASMFVLMIKDGKLPRDIAA
jgi:hypothetical protein